MFMLVLHILCHNLVGYESSKGLGTKIAECGYETSKPGYESSGYEKSVGTKRLVTLSRTETRGKVFYLEIKQITMAQTFHKGLLGSCRGNFGCTPFS